MEIFPVFVGLLSFDPVGFVGVVLGVELPEDHEELFEGGGFANASNPKEEN